MSIQIRAIGSYEIVLYDKDMHRILEKVSNISLMESRVLAETMLSDDIAADSYTISRIIDNSKYNTWDPSTHKELQ